MNIDIIVDDDDHLCKGKLSCTPEAHHNLLSLAWISFLYRDNSQPLEPCSFGKVHINYFWLLKFHQRQECLFHNLSYVCILHNRFANNSCQINRIFLHHYTSQMKRRKWLGFSVIASMVSKRPLRPHVLRVNITFKDDLCSRRNFQVNCLALDKPYTFAPNYTCIKIFVQPFWHWCYRCIDNGRVCSYNHSNFCFFPHLLVQCVMVSSSFMNLPVHSCSSLIIFLLPVSGFFVTTIPKVMNLPASFGHDLSAGRKERLGLSVIILSITSPFFSTFGAYPASSAIFGRDLNFSSRPEGTCMLRISVILFPSCSKSSTPRAILSLFSEPKRLPATGMLNPSTLSNTTAGPLLYMSLLSISAISRSTET